MTDLREDRITEPLEAVSCAVAQAFGLGVGLRLEAAFAARDGCAGAANGATVDVEDQCRGIVADGRVSDLLVGSFGERVAEADDLLLLFGSEGQELLYLLECEGGFHSLGKILVQI